MAEKVPSFQEGGALWFTDLTTPDSMYILPILSGLFTLATIEVNLCLLSLHSFRVYSFLL